MWKCSKCGEQVEDGINICPACGAEYEEEVTDLKDSENQVNEPENEVAEEKTEPETAGVNEVAEAEEDISKSPADETAENADTEVMAEAADETADAEDTETENTVWSCPVCFKENDGDFCSECGTPRPADEVQKMTNKKRNILIAAVAVVVLATVAVFVWFFNGRYIKPTGEDGAIQYEDIEKANDTIWGNDVALKVNGIEVPKNIYKAVLTNKALVYQQDYCSQSGSFDITKLDKFKWDDVADKKTGKTHAQVVKEDTVDMLSQMYVFIALGEENGIEASKEDKDAIKEQISKLKEAYGSQLKDILKLNGFDSVKTYENLMLLEAKASAVSTDMKDNMKKYKKEDTSTYENAKSSVITAKHILIMGGDNAERTMAEAKKLAEDVLKKIKKGEDFDKLMKKYNEDTGEPEEGYVFGKGDMVEEFEKAAFKLGIGDVSKLVKTKFGYHIIKRELSSADIYYYEKANAKISVNKSLLEDMGVKADLKKIQQAADNTKSSK